MSWPGTQPFLDQIAGAFIQMEPLIPTYVHLITSAIFPIYIAAHASLRRPSSAAPAKKDKSESRKNADNDDENEDSTTPIESLTTSDAILFPVLAGFTLTGLYLIIRWLKDPAILNKILGYYFSWVGTFFTFKFLKDSFYIGRSFVFPSQLTCDGELRRVNPAQNTFIVDDSAKANESKRSTSTSSKLILPLTKYRLYWTLRRRLFTKVYCVLSTRQPLTKSSGKFSVDLLDVAATLSSIALAVLPNTLKQTPWYLTNLSGFSFCYGSLQFITPGTSATGSLLLSLLFFYDIYMVFYTPMMVTVATKLDVPIKLLIPRPDDRTCPSPLVGLSIEDAAKEVQKCIERLAKRPKSMAMLGLGDIVIPGIMIAFALRFDLYNYYCKLRAETGEKSERPTYTAARGMWAERFYTAKAHWSSILQAKAFPKPYFTATMFGYVAGMVATVVVMQVFNHAQPALLYLVPGVLSTFWGTALWRGEVRLLWGYDEAIEEKEAEQKMKKEEEEKEKAAKDKKDEKKEEKDTKPTEADLSKPVVSFNIWLAPPPAKKPSSISGKATPAESIEISSTKDVQDSGAASQDDADSDTSSTEITSQEDTESDVRLA